MFSALIILIIVSTSYDILTSKFNGKSIKFFAIFSLYSNLKTLMKINYSESAIRCIDGIKVLSAFWIAIGTVEFFNTFQF